MTSETAAASVLARVKASLMQEVAKEAAESDDKAPLNVPIAVRQAPAMTIEEAMFCSLWVSWREKA
jgi:hypothetical protein